MSIPISRVGVAEMRFGAHTSSMSMNPVSTLCRVSMSKSPVCSSATTRWLRSDSRERRKATRGRASVSANLPSHPMRVQRDPIT